MEFLRGASLASFLEAEGPLPCVAMCPLGRDLCAALEALESAGLVHRDIKPSNIILELTDGWC